MRAVAGLLLMMLFPACAPAAIDGGFDSANPAARMYAMERAVREGDTRVVRRIIEQLDSDDPAVRMLAIGALERLTGETHGYRHHESRDQRHEAMQRWVVAAENGSLNLTANLADHGGGCTP